MSATWKSYYDQAFDNVIEVTRHCIIQHVYPPNSFNWALQASEYKRVVTKLLCSQARCEDFLANGGSMVVIRRDNSTLHRLTKSSTVLLPFAVWTKGATNMMAAENFLDEEIKMINAAVDLLEIEMKEEEEPKKN